MKKLVMGTVLFLLVVLPVLALTPEEESTVGRSFDFTAADNTKTTYRYCPAVDVTKGCSQVSPTTWAFETGAPLTSSSENDPIIANLNEQLQTHLTTLAAIPDLSASVEKASETIKARSSLNREPGNLCYNQRRAKNPSNVCFEFNERALGLINDFKKLTYPAVYLGSLDDKVSAEALFDQGSGFKQIAELKQQFEGLPPGFKEESPDLVDALSKENSVFVNWNEASGDLKITIADSSPSDDEYTVNFRGQVLGTFPEKDVREGDLIKIAVNPTTDLGVSVDNIKEVVDMRVEVNGDKGLIATLAPNDVFVDDPLHYPFSPGFKAADAPTIGSVVINYFRGDRLLVKFLATDPAAVGNNDYALVDINADVLAPLSFRNEQDISFFATVDLKTNDKLRDLLESNDASLAEMSLSIKNKQTGVQGYFFPHELSYDYARTAVGSSPIVSQPPVTPTRTSLTTRATGPLFGEEMLQLAQTHCSGSIVSELSNSRGINEFRNIISSRGYDDLIKDVTNNPKEQAILAGMMAFESSVDPEKINDKAVGLFQFIPSTAHAVGLCGDEDCSSGDQRTDAEESIKAAKRLLDRSLVELRGNARCRDKITGASEDNTLKYAVAAHNKGAPATCTAIAQVSKSNPNWAEVAPHSGAKCYVPAVLTYAEAFADLFGLKPSQGVTASQDCEDIPVSGSDQATCRNAGCLPIHTFGSFSCRERPTVDSSDDPCDTLCGDGIGNLCSREDCNAIGPHCKFEDGLFVNSCTSSLSGGCPNIDSATKVFPVGNPSTPNDPSSIPIIGGSCYGPRTLRGSADWHDGIDFRARTGTPIFAVDDATVRRVCAQPLNDGDAGYDNSLCSGYGTYIILEHDDGSFTRYSHLSSTDVRRGESVNKGQKIGEAGNTGFSNAAHLDFKVYCDSDLSGDVEEGEYRRDPVLNLPFIPKANFPTHNNCPSSPTLQGLAASGPAASFGVGDASSLAPIQPSGPLPDDFDEIPESAVAAEVELGKVYLLEIGSSFAYPNNVLDDLNIPIEGEPYLGGGPAKGVYIEDVDAESITYTYFEVDTSGVIVSEFLISGLKASNLDSYGNDDFIFHYEEPNLLYVEPLA